MKKNTISQISSDFDIKMVNNITSNSIMDKIPRAFDISAHHQKFVAAWCGERFEPRCERLFIVLMPRGGVECVSLSRVSRKNVFPSHSFVRAAAQRPLFTCAAYKGYFLTCVTGNNNLGSTLCVTKARRLRFVKTTPLWKVLFFTSLWIYFSPNTLPIEEMRVYKMLLSIEHIILREEWISLLLYLHFCALKYFIWNKVQAAGEWDSLLLDRGLAFSAC